MSIGVEERAEQIRKIQLFSSAKNSSFDFNDLKTMPRTFSPPHDDDVKHLTEKDALDLGIRHGLTGDQYTFFVRKGEKEDGDTGLLRDLENKFGAVLGFNKGIPGVPFSVLHAEMMRLQHEEGLAPLLSG
jgi:hypothetical protein